MRRTLIPFGLTADNSRMQPPSPPNRDPLHRRLRHALRYPRLELLLVAAGVAGGALVVLAVFSAGPKPPVRPVAHAAPSTPVGSPKRAAPRKPAEPARGSASIEEVAARVLRESRAARRRLQPTVTTATGIAREVERRYRLPDGRALRVAEVTSTLPVASIEVVARDAGQRSIATDNGIFFELCGRGTVSHCALQRRGGTGASALLARSQALELALRTFRDTRAAVVVVSLPQSATREAWLVFERASLRAVDTPVLLRHLHAGEPGASLSLARRVDSLTLGRLFTPAGLVSHSETTDSVVAVPLSP